MLAVASLVSCTMADSDLCRNCLEVVSIRAAVVSFSLNLLHTQYHSIINQPYIIKLNRVVHTWNNKLRVTSPIDSLYLESLTVETARQELISICTTPSSRYLYSTESWHHVAMHRIMHSDRVCDDAAFGTLTLVLDFFITTFLIITFPFQTVLSILFFATYLCIHVSVSSI